MRHKRLAILGSISFGLALSVIPVAPAGATDPANGYIEISVSGRGCRADIHHATNLYYYAVAWTDNPRKPPYDPTLSCWRSAADVYYPYLQKTVSGWGYFNSQSVSPYQTYVTGSEHNAAIGTGEDVGLTWLN